MLQFLFHLNIILVLSRLCLVWTLLFCIWKTDGFVWLYVCVSLNLVACVFYLIFSCSCKTITVYYEIKFKMFISTLILFSFRFSCINSLHIYTPAEQFDEDISQDTQKLGMKVMKFNTCNWASCGPNFCCCFAYYNL